MKHRYLFIISVLLLSCNRAGIVDVELNELHYDFCSLESCEDRMDIGVFILNNESATINKSNWVARVSLKPVPSDEDYHLSFSEDDPFQSVKQSFCKSFDPPVLLSETILTAAKMTSDIVITADCQLFGRPAGENLADKFQIPFFPKHAGKNEHYLIAYDQRTILKDLFDSSIIPVSLEEYCANGVMIHRSFWLKPSEVHDESPERVSFHIEFNAWTDLFVSYAVQVDDKYIPKGHDRKLYADFTVDMSGKEGADVWNKDHLYSYPLHWDWEGVDYAWD